MIAALVLAGGASSRMGVAKAGLTLGAGHTVLSRGVATLLAAGLPRVVVVAGAHPAEVRGALRGSDPRVRVVENPQWRQGQLTSLVTGLDHVDSPLVEAVLVSLVDVPLVSADTVRAVVRAWRQTSAPIVRPARGAVHGHPVLFDRTTFDALRHADPGVGAKAVVRALQARIVNVPVEDAGAFTDLDTPVDYERVKAMLDESERMADNKRRGLHR